MLHEPDISGAPECVIVLVHGGFWRSSCNRWVASLLARDAVRQGFAVFNIEYRRHGRFGGGGGWPQTFDDIADAVSLVADRFVDARIMLVGHSADGHLALATAARRRELVDGVISMAPPTDLRLLSERGSESIDDLVVGAPLEERRSLTSPIEMLPTGVPTLCIHSDAGAMVLASLWTRYVEDALAAGDDAELVLVSGERHRSALWPRSATWQIVLASIDAWIEELRESSRSGEFVPMETA